MQSVEEQLSQMQIHANQIKNDFVYLTENILHKSMKSANKQLQDTLMNYFLENQVGTILKAPMKMASKRAVRISIEQELPKEGTKYMNLLKLFEIYLVRFNCQDEYMDLLIKLIYLENNNDKTSDVWKSNTRKRILSVLLYVEIKKYLQKHHKILLIIYLTSTYVHWHDENERKTKFHDFFALWDYVFPGDPLPQRKNRKLVLKEEEIPTLKPVNYASHNTQDQSLHQDGFSFQQTYSEQKINGNEFDVTTKDQVQLSNGISQQVSVSQYNAQENQINNFYQNDIHSEENENFDESGNTMEDKDEIQDFVQQLDKIDLAECDNNNYEFPKYNRLGSNQMNNTSNEYSPNSQFDSQFTPSKFFQNRAFFNRGEDRRDSNRSNGIMNDERFLNRYNSDSFYKQGSLSFENTPLNRDQVQMQPINIDDFNQINNSNNYNNYNQQTAEDNAMNDNSNRNNHNQYQKILYDNTISSPWAQQQQQQHENFSLQLKNTMEQN